MLTTLTSSRFLRQKHSWSEIKVSERQFHQIMELHHVSPAFIEVVCAFGWKTEELETGYHGLDVVNSQDGSKRWSNLSLACLNAGMLQPSAHEVSRLVLSSRLRRHSWKKGVIGSVVYPSCWLLLWPPCPQCNNVHLHTTSDAVLDSLERCAAEMSGFL